jgi:hypothetical protein
MLKPSDSEVVKQISNALDSGQWVVLRTKTEGMVLFSHSLIATWVGTDLNGRDPGNLKHCSHNTLGDLGEIESIRVVEPVAYRQEQLQPSIGYGKDFEHSEW